jgi:co-chaperonin GroES (HSP10)
MLKALKTRVIIEKIEAEKTTSSGIVLQRAIEDTVFARVCDVGPDVDAGVRAGDRLVVDWNKVGYMTHEGSTYFVIDQCDILAVVEE